jgi:PAS domain S-box-containing protein
MNDRIKREAAIRRLNEKSRFSNIPSFKHNEIQTQKNEKYRSYEKQDKDSLIQQIIELEHVFNFHRSVMQNVNSGIITLDLGGQITFANRHATEVLNLELTELLSKPIQYVLPEFNFEEYARALPANGIEVKKENTQYENVYLRLNLESYTDVVNDHTGIILTIEDISELSRLRNQMERMDQLATLGEVSKGIAHELRNPLAGAKSIAQVLHANYEDNEEFADYTNRIVKEIDRANVLLQEFFRFAKPDRPKKSYVDTEAFLDLIVSNSLSKVETNIRLKTDFSELTPHFFADRAQVDQILRIILDNAIDVLTNVDSAELCLVTKRVEKKSKGRSSEFVQITVSNNGPQIEKEHAKKIFNPFFSTKVKNVGLGLSIASRLAEENAGSLSLDKKRDSGAAFILLLPTS